MDEPKPKSPKSAPCTSSRASQASERVRSRILEEQIQQAIADGPPPHRDRGLRPARDRRPPVARRRPSPVQIRVTGHPGQRLGSMGFPNTVIEVLGPVSDDVGWLNAGAEIIVHGNAGNGAANGMAQGRVCVAREHRRARHDHDQAQPALQRARAVGAGLGRGLLRRVHGRRHRRGLRARGPGRPKTCSATGRSSGMVGGKVFFRGPHGGLQPGRRAAGAHRGRRLGLAAGRPEGRSSRRSAAPSCSGRSPSASTGSCWSRAGRTKRPAGRCARSRPSTARSGTPSSAPAG